MLASLQVQDGPRNLGTISFWLPAGRVQRGIGELRICIAANVASGWSTSSSGMATNWVSTNDTATSGIISVFTSGAEGIGLSQIDSPVLRHRVRRRDQVSTCF